MSAVSKGNDAWWRLGAADLARRTEDLGWDAAASRHNLSWIGREWNGRSDLELDGRTLTAQTLTAVIAQLRVAIADQHLRVARLPDHRSVRRQPSAPSWPSTVVVDIDFGDFIQPFRIGMEDADRSPGSDAAGLVDATMDGIRRFHAVRDEAAELHLQLRAAFVEQSAIAEVVPLWFRSPPYISPTRYPTPLQGVHEMAFLMRDEDLNLVSNGIRLVSSVAQLEQYLEFHGEFQRRRATTHARLAAIGSAALVTDVAAGLFASRGLDPLATLAALRAARAQGDHGGIVIRTDTTRERLTLVEGIVDVAFDFEGGDYASGKLTLNGEYPKTLAMATKGRAMAAFVDHPAFRAAGVTVRQARALRGRLRLYHRVQLGPIEEAAAAWGPQSHAVATTVATGPG